MEHMSNESEKPVTPEEAKLLFAAMRKALEEGQPLPETVSPETPHIVGGTPAVHKKITGFQTGAGAMADWQREQEAKEDERPRRKAA